MHDSERKFVGGPRLPISPTIPEIEDERLDWLLSVVTPVIKNSRGQFCPFDSPKCTRSVAYTWSPILQQSVRGALLVDATFLSYHSWGYHGFFKPSLAEVYSALDANIPLPEDLESGEYFLWLDPESVHLAGEDLLHRPDEKNISGYHRAICVLLRRCRT